MNLITLGFKDGESFTRTVEKSSPPTMVHEAFEPLTAGTQIVVDIHIPSVQDHSWRLRGTRLEEYSAVEFEAGQESAWNFLLQSAALGSVPLARRTFSRVPLRLPVKFSSHDPEHGLLGQGHTTDVSIGGLAMQSANTLPQGSEVSVILSPDTPMQLTLPGLVVWRRADVAALGAGIEFTDLSGADSIRLRRMIYDVALHGNFGRYESPPRLSR